MGILHDIIKKFSDALQDGIQDGIQDRIVKKLDHTAENLKEWERERSEEYIREQYEKEMERERESIRNAGVAFAGAGVKAGEAVNAVQKAIRAMAEPIYSLAKIERENTNNWRKMHGLPMRRRNSDARRRKR